VHKAFQVERQFWLLASKNTNNFKQLKALKGKITLSAKAKASQKRIFF
jgi:hypothetical protein